MAEDLNDRGREEDDDSAAFTEEEYQEEQEKDQRITRRVLRFFKAIWEAINFFTSKGMTGKRFSCLPVPFSR